MMSEGCQPWLLILRHWGLIAKRLKNVCILQMARVKFMLGVQCLLLFDPWRD